MAVFGSGTRLLRYSLSQRTNWFNLKIPPGFDAVGSLTVSAFILNNASLNGSGSLSVNATVVPLRTQGATYTGGIGANHIDVTFTSAVTSGNLITGVVVWNNTGGLTLSSVVDDKSNTYYLGTTVTDGVMSAAPFCHGNTTNGPITVTATLSGTSSTDNITILVEEFAFASADDPRDVYTGQLQTSPGTATDGVTSGNITTTKNGDLIWGVTIDTQGASWASSGTGFRSGMTG